MMERLTKRSKDGTWYKNCEGCPTPDYGFSCTDCEETMRQRDKLADYEDAEEEGRIIKLPFTFGDIIYEISESRPEIYEWTIKGFQIFEDATYICVNDYTWINITKLGETIFRTLDEARAKLKEMEVGSHGDS